MHDGSNTKLATEMYQQLLMAGSPTGSPRWCWQNILLMIQSNVYMTVLMQILIQWFLKFIRLLKTLKSVFFKKRTWQNQLIQKFAKTAHVICGNQQGLFCIFLDQLILSSMFLNKMDFNYYRAKLLNSTKYVRNSETQY